MTLIAARHREDSRHCCPPSCEGLETDFRRGDCLRDSSLAILREGPDVGKPNSAGPGNAWASSTPDLPARGFAAPGLTAREPLTMVVGIPKEVQGEPDLHAKRR